MCTSACVEWFQGRLERVFTGAVPLYWIVFMQRSCRTKPKMPVSAIQQPGQLPGQEPARHGAGLCTGAASHIAQPGVATPDVIPLQAENFRFQTLSDTIDPQARKKKIPWNTENKEIHSTCGKCFRGSCLDLIWHAGRACSLQECHIN